MEINGNGFMAGCDMRREKSFHPILSLESLNKTKIFPEILPASRFSRRNFANLILYVNLPRTVPAVFNPIR